MFCSKCGKENSNENKYCSSCGDKLNLENISVSNNKKIKQPKVISILALIFSILVAPIGFILSIIGIAKCNKYKKKQGNTSKYLPLNIAGLIISIIVTIIILFIAFALGIVFLIFSKQDPKLNGTWNCKYNNNSSYTMKVKFDNGEFEWGKYQDFDDNKYDGTYSILSKKYKNNLNEYSIRLDAKSRNLNGVSYSSARSKYIRVIFNESDATIKYDNDTYYCVKEK